MNPRQKVLAIQLQIASIGLLISIFGIAWKHWMLLVFGLCILLCGLARAWLLGRLMKNAKDPADADLDLDAIIEEAKQKEKDVSKDLKED